MADNFGNWADEVSSAQKSESRFTLLQTELNDTPQAAAKEEYFCRVYTIFRPWQECARCMRDFRPKKNAEGNWEEAALVLDGDGDYVCPHNEMKLYEEQINKIIGAKKRARLLRRNVETLKNGTVQALVEWAERTEVPNAAPKAAPDF